MAKKSKYKLSSSSNSQVVTRGQIIPATVIEEKRRVQAEHQQRRLFHAHNRHHNQEHNESSASGYQKKCEDLAAKLHTSFKWNKCHNWITRCNLFNVCMHLFEEDDNMGEEGEDEHEELPMKERESGERKSPQPQTFSTVQAAAATSSPFLSSHSHASAPFFSSLASFGSGSNVSQFNNHLAAGASSPVLSDMKRRRRRSAFDYIIEEIGLREPSNSSFLSAAGRHQQKHAGGAASSLCFTCATCALNYQPNRSNIQYMDDIYECAECAEIDLDINNNFKKSATSKFSLMNGTGGGVAAANDHRIFAKTVGGGLSIGNQQNTSSKVTFASLFSDMSIFDQNSEYHSPGAKIVTPDVSPPMANTTATSSPCAVDENNNYAVSKEELKRPSILVKSIKVAAVGGVGVGSGARAGSECSQSEPDEFFECRSMSVDADFTTESENSDRIYENNDFVYI